jgi:hypothetical protein
MGSNEAFVLALGALMAAMVFWAFKRLPDERWQFVASVPIMKDGNGHWHGLNFTYYGLLTANALVFGVAMLTILLGALHVPMSVTLTLILAVLLVCLPAAKWVARLVEGKPCTYTIAGAFFVGIFTAPAVIVALNALLPKVGFAPVPMTPALAAIMIAYAFGEGLGRLACISFGCCYGVALQEARPMVRRIFDHWHFVFSGDTKKISYASGLAGKQVVPIQAITSILYIAVGLAATWFLLRGRSSMAFVFTMAVTQGWRALSEVLRADYRGNNSISTYQIMGIAAIAFAGIHSYFTTDHVGVTADLAAGIEALWHAEVLLALQTLWALVFVMFGKSMVTGAQISFHLREDRI